MPAGSSSASFDSESLPRVAIIKHTNPCGAAIGDHRLEAYIRALAADPVSAFGGVIGINRTRWTPPPPKRSPSSSSKPSSRPSFTPEALARFAAKKNLRLVQITQPQARYGNQADLRRLPCAGSPTCAASPQPTSQIVTERHPTADELETLLFAWTRLQTRQIERDRLCAHRRGFGQTVGVGAGQMSRVDAARFGAMKAVLPLAGSVAASDAFFPFPDGLEVVADAGATAIIQPGGSVRDAEVIEAANRRGLAMVFTGIRHFRHG